VNEHGPQTFSCPTPSFFGRLSQKMTASDRSRPFVKRFALCYQTVVCPVLSCPVCPVCNVAVLWPNSWMDQYETWHAGRPRPWPHCVRWEPSFPSPKGGRAPPQFSAHICCGQMAGWIKMALGREVGLGPIDIVLDGDPAPLPQKGAESPIFGPCLLWPDGWMDQFKMPLVVEVGLGPGHNVLDGDPAPHPQRDTAPNFRPIFVEAEWLDGSRCHLVGR